MYPVIDLGWIVISTYSLMIFIGVIVGLIVVYFTVYKGEGISNFTAFRLIICAAISGVAMYLGALFFDSLFHSIDEGHFTIGGITWLGGVVTSFPVMIILIHFLVPVSKGRALYTFSLIIPAVVIAHGIGRIGCFLAGCCYGCETEMWFGVTFPGMTHKVVPTQLFEVIFETLLFTVMMLLRKKIKGHQLEMYLICYAIFRFIIEFFRGDSRGSTGIGLSPAQFLDIVCFISGILIILFHKNIIFKKLYKKCVIWSNEAKEIAVKKKSFLDFKRSPEERIRELFNMKENGIITEDEFQKKKEALLGKIK